MSRVLMMVLAAGAVCAPSEGALSPRIVQTQYGALRGIIDRLGNNGIGLQPVERFLGVPYATAPVNGLRFMPPITPSPWDGVRTADRPAPRCPGRPPPSDDAPVKYLTSRANASSSEDCLYLNVFYPTFNGEFSKEKPPVVLLVEASSWEESNANRIDGSALASRGRLMVASVNFRLGILGFLKTSPKDSPQGNYGMLDVIAAIHWLRQNAGAFGGDPGRLTLVGIGHGAALVHLLMLSPVARGLFHGAVLLGGSALGPAGVQPQPELVRQQVAALAGCWDPAKDPDAERYDLAPCLRKLTLERLLEVGRLRTPRFLAAYAPFVDHAGPARALHDPAGFLRDLARMRSEAFPKCDLMVGVATYELPGEMGPVGEEKRDSVLRTLVRNVYHYHNSEIFAVLRNEYTDWEVGARNNTDAVTHSLHEALSDGLVVSPLMELLRYHAGLGAGRTYLYHVNHPQASGPEARPAGGGFHAEGVAFLLGLPLTADLRPSRQLAEEVELAEQLVSYVAGFCYAGDPNEHGATEKSGKAGGGLAYWDQYTLGEQRYLSLGIKSRVRTHYRSHKMSVWLRLIPQLHQPGEEGVVLSHHYFRAGQQQPPVPDEDYFDGVVRPYGQQETRAPGRSTLPPPDDEAPDGDNNQAEPDRGAPTSTECPTQQPYVATQLSNSNGSSLRNRSSSREAERTPDDPWPYTQMLVIVVATGVTLLFLNAVVVVCFFVVRRRASDSGGAPAPAACQSDRPEGAKRFVLHEREVHDANCERVRGKIVANRVESVSSIIDLTCPHVTSVAASSGARVEHFTGDAFPFDDQSHSSMCNKVDSAIELFDCYAYDERFLPPAGAPQSFAAGDNEITV